MLLMFNGNVNSFDLKILFEVQVYVQILRLIVTFIVYGYCLRIIIKIIFTC
jgi:hypothetical protein